MVSEVHCLQTALTHRLLPRLPWALSCGAQHCIHDLRHAILAGPEAAVPCARDLAVTCAPGVPQTHLHAWVDQLLALPLSGWS